MGTAENNFDDEAARLIQGEAAYARSKWGDALIRVDEHNAHSRGQLLHAAAGMAMGQIHKDATGQFSNTSLVWPNNFDRAYLRDYGSNLANLAVIGAFIQNEIARRLALGEQYTRTSRPEPTDV